MAIRADSSVLQSSLAARSHHSLASSSLLLITHGRTAGTQQRLSRTTDARRAAGLSDLPAVIYTGIGLHIHSTLFTGYASVR